MIKLETAHIEEVRGIRKLDIDFQKGTFVIWTSPDKPPNAGENLSELIRKQLDPQPFG
jgi:hypothetical protein